jgi:hypothetical protein
LQGKVFKKQNMKTLKGLLTLSTVWLVFIGLTSCDQKVGMETVVYEDGKIDRTILLSEVDSMHAAQNIFGISAAKGWDVSVTPLPKKEEAESGAKVKQVNISFHKKFSSVEESNQELYESSDTLFHIKGKFEKRFRWFYTYLDYSDTYSAINRFQYLKPENYFTPEDFAFIDRLPAEGKSISRADSIYLDQLNEKIVDHFAMQAIFEEHYQLMLSVLRDHNIGTKYIDSYLAERDYLFSILTNKENDDLFEEDAFMHQVVDSLNFDVPMDKIKQSYVDKSESIKSLTNFMSKAAFETKYSHVIRMPWEITMSNADSVNSNSLFYQPPAVKMMFRDYSMYASSRKLNYWTLFVSGLVIVATIFAFARKRKAL